MKALGIGCRQLEEEAVSCVRFYRTIKPEALVLVLLVPDGLHPLERDPSALGGDQSDAAFILEIHLDFLILLELGDQGLQLGAEVFLKASTASSSFLGLLGRATLDVAPNL